MRLLRILDPFDHPDWIFEPKMDGFRALAYVRGHHCILISRNRHTFKSGPQLAGEIAHSVRVHSAILDFKQLVVRLLVAMEYGGSMEDAGKALGKPGDEVINGIIKGDRLGLDVIYIQAKRWERTIGRPDIQQFAGALQRQRARKGVFITTPSFSAEARQYAERIDTRIILIEDTELAKLMIAHGVGVTPVAVYELKRVDSDFFAEE